MIDRNRIGDEMAIKAFVFDMDGTILHTLPDLVIAANETLERMGFPTRTYDELLGFMGLGGVHLIDRALPPDTAPEVHEQAFELFREIYIASDYAETEPFPGIAEALGALRERGAKTAVLSNKFHAGTCFLADKYLPGLFDVVRGDKPPVPRKPDPTSLLQVIEELGVQPNETAYVGDTGIDVKTARRAGVQAVGVSWGYDAANPLPADDLDAYLHEPSELLNLL